MCQLDQALRALAHPYRRHALSCLLQHRTATLPDLAEHVAAEDRDAPVHEIPPEAVRDVYLALYHTHVPMLEAGDLVRYEQEGDLVAVTDRATAVLGDVERTVTRLLATV